MKRSEFPFLDPTRVRWAEVDMQRVVFNAHYLTWFDTAMGAYWRALALPYEESLAALGGDLFLRRATVDYEAPARYDDALDVGIRFAGVGTSSLRFLAAVFRGDERLVHGELTYVWTDPPGTPAPRPRRVPAVLAEAFEAHAVGEPMVAMEVGDWQALGEAARALRTAVFVDEQHIPANLEQDEADTVAVHALARNRLGVPVGTGRLLAGEGGHPARIGRMAVRRDLRGAQVGRTVLEALMAHAGARGDTQVALNAQASAVGFYRRAGFLAHGDAFIVAGIEHQEMRRAP